MNVAAQPPASGRHSGAALLLVLLTLSVLLLLSGGAVHSIWLGEKMLRNAQDRAQAFQAAEAALSDAEDDILRSSRASLFAQQNMHAFPAEPGCSTSGDRLGLCLAAPGRMLWQDVDLSPAAKTGVPYGHFTGNRYPAENGSPATPPPRYLIELVRNGVPLAGTATDHFSLRYRITAIGFNQRATAHVLLEKIVQKE